MTLLVALALAAPRTRPVQDPDLAEAVRTATWTDAEGQLRAAVQAELARLDVGDVPWVEAAASLEESRRNGDWQLRWQTRAYEAAIEAEDPVSAEAALKMVESITGEAAPSLRWRLRWLRARLLLPMVGPWALLAAAAYGAGRGLDSLTRRRPRARQHKRLENPFVTGRPLRDAGLVFGREAMLRRLLDIVADGGAAYLTGERRIGKTTLLLQAGEAWERQGGIAVFADISGSVDQGSVKVVKRALKLAGEGRLLLLVDEVDALNGADPEALSRLEELTRGHAVLIAGVGLNMERCPWDVEVLPVAPLTQEACRALLVEPVAGLCTWEDSALERVLEEADGRPMVVQLYGLNCVERMSLLGRTLVKSEDVDAVKEPVDRAWRAIQDHGLESEVVPIDVDSARLELGRLLQEIEELELMLGSA